MRNSIAKKLRRAAEKETIGLSPAKTKEHYKLLKKTYKEKKRK